MTLAYSDTFLLSWKCHCKRGSLYNWNYWIVQCRFYKIRKWESRFISNICKMKNCELQNDLFHFWILWPWLWFELQKICHLSRRIRNCNFLEFYLTPHYSWLSSADKVAMVRHVYRGEPKEPSQFGSVSGSEIQNLPFSPSGIGSLYRKEPKEPTN